MARANKGATERTLMRPQRIASSRKGIELVTTTSCKNDVSIRSTAGPDNTACVAQTPNPQPACFQRPWGVFPQLPRRINQVVHNQTMLSFHVADDVHHFRDV